MGLFMVDITHLNFNKVMSVQGNFRQKLNSCEKLPHIQFGSYGNANKKANCERVILFFKERNISFGKF